MNKDIHNLYSAYKFIYENTTQAPSSHTQESLNQMDVDNLTNILKQLQARETNLQLLVKQSIGDQSNVML